MFVIALALWQAAAPAEPAAEVQPASVPAEEASAADAPDEPKMKKICRKVIDPRVNTLAGRQTRCKYVPLDEKAS